MSNAVCNAVTPTVSNAVRRSVQNQNQNQTVVKGFSGLSVAKKSSIATAVEGLGPGEKRMAADAAKIRGLR